MQKRHTFIATFEARPGMLLARTLSKVSHHRLFTLPAGTRLSEDTIRQLAMHDINCLVIEEDDPRNEAEKALDKSDIEQATREIFREADMTRPAVSALYRAVLDYRLAHA